MIFIFMPKTIFLSWSFLYFRRMLPKTENPWDVESIYMLQYFICPSCEYKHVAKQNFICHAFDAHQEESVNYLKNINDGSLCDILCPWHMCQVPCTQCANAWCPQYFVSLTSCHWHACQLAPRLLPSCPDARAVRGTTALRVTVLSVSVTMRS